MRFFNWYTEIAITKIQTSDRIICIGQKPQIKNKICLELVARDNDALLPTNFELETFKKKLKANNITYIESKNPGTSYCNLVYWNVLLVLVALLPSNPKSHSNLLPFKAAAG